MISLGDVALLRPWWLLALPVVLLIAWDAQRRSTWPVGWSAAMDPALMRAMARLGRILPGTDAASRLPAAVLVALAIALAGPAVRDPTSPTFRNLDGMIVVFDLSRSMAQGGALPAAQAAARLAVQAAATRPVGLVVYAGDAYLGSALTIDGEPVSTTIAALDGETIPDAGSCLACGLRLAARILAESGTLHSDVVVVSDGGGTAEALSEAAALVPAGARISTLAATPTERPSEMPAADPAALAALARAGGGVAASVADPAPLLAAIRAKGRAEAVPAAIRHIGWHDWGRALAAIPLLLTLGLFRRSA